ncbi:hypothetical protein NUW58_g3340 [Xylaria curta]|uniref:Uncharacterized protein n=1 Tax=Xylaria curta TaxID=42375 RepID=A0ACC1PCM7_9PEZI|nr:hypothetical protein NUW58_g3340 [Xylaria curta]
MADIIGAISLATQLASLCIKAISTLKKFTKDVRSAESDLAEVLTRVQQSHNLLDIIRAALIEIKNSNAKEFSIVISVDGFRETVDEILKLAKDVLRSEARLSLIRKVTWSLQKSRKARLVERLKDHETELLNLITTVNVIAQLRSQTVMEEKIRDATARAELRDAFSGITLVDDDEESKDKGVVARTWLGHLYTDDDQLPEGYCELRRELSDAAFFGSWPRVWDILQEARYQFDESWVNAIRMKPHAEANLMSFWTPLHQAVYMGAPATVVQRLVNLGASRTLRTRWTEFERLDITALELAYDLEETDLQDVLCPVIRNSVPAGTLAQVQKSFHELIQRQVYGLVDASRLYLPLLEPLTELHMSAIWFPIRCNHPGAGYLYRLDGRDLLIQSRNIIAKVHEATYRLADGEIFDVTDNPVIFVE